MLVKISFSRVIVAALVTLRTLDVLMHRPDMLIHEGRAKIAYLLSCTFATRFKTLSPNSVPK